MDKAMLRAVLACLLWILHIPPAPALDSETEKTVRAATFEFRAPAVAARSKDLVGTAFATGPNEFVTAAHLFDRAIGSHFGHPVLMDSSQVEYRVADVLQYSEQQDYVIFSLERPPAVKPLAIRRNGQTEPDLYFAGWRSDGKVVIERGTFSGLTRDEGSGQFDWLRFSGSLWSAIGGGPLLDRSGRAIGVVQARARDGGANYAVPIGLPPDGAPGTAHIHAVEMLRSLMPTVSSVKPLEAEIPLPMSFEKFSRELQQLRLAYFDREISPLLEATRGNFVMTGEGAAEVCTLLNGKRCECRARRGATGVLVVDDPRADEVIRQVSVGKDVSRTVAGVVVLRSKSVSRAGANQDRVYIDFHDRTWHVRTWPLLDQDLEWVSLARKLPDGYVVLTRTVPTALTYAAELQVKFVANLVYYGCEELQAEGVAQVADTMHR
jgi:hypothetical protein